MIRRLLTLAFAALWLQGALLVAQTQLCVPQFLNGNSGPFQWRTTLVLQNQDQVQAQVRLNFYDNDGVPAQQFEMRRPDASGSRWQVGPNGQFDTEPIRARSAVGYQSLGQGALQAGYVVIQSQNRLQAHARVQLFDSAGNLISEVIVVPGQPFRNSSFYADRSEGAGIGLALANPSSAQSAVCTLDIIDSDGITQRGTTQLTLGPHSQTARFLFELFPDILEGEVGLVRISCSEPAYGLALHLHGLVMAQIPIVIED